MSASTVQIQQILDANIGTVREDPGHNLEILVRSIRKIGLQHAILLTPDFLVLDGARRILACQKLGMTDIPVICTDHWPTIFDYFTGMRAVEENNELPFEQMSWLELIDLVRIRLRGLYWSERSRIATEVRRKNRREGTRSPKHSDFFASAMTDMLGLKRGNNEYKTLNDIGAALEKAQKTDPLLAKSLREKVRSIEAHTGQLYAAWGLVRESVRNPSEDIVPVHDLKSAQDQTTRLRGMIQILEHLGIEAKTIGPINAAVSNEELVELKRLIKNSLRPLSTLHRRMLDGRNISGEKEEE